MQKTVSAAQGGPRAGGGPRASIASRARGGPRASIASRARGGPRASSARVHVAAQLSAPVQGLMLTFMRLDESTSWSSSMAWRRPGAVLESPCRGGSGRGRSASPLLRLPNGPFRMGEIQYYIVNGQAKV
jgi:hypothetical protein